MGTAWFILIDADRRMGAAFQDARHLAGRFVAAMGPNDIVNLMFFNDRQVVRDSTVATDLETIASRSPHRLDQGDVPQPGTQPLAAHHHQDCRNGRLQGARQRGLNVKVPMHQAMVVLSSGFGGTDPSTSGPGALELQKYMSNGRFPPDNTALPKTPVPVISIYFPHATYDEFKNNSLDFMQNLANPQIGGFFSVMRKGESKRSDNIVRAVRTRFSTMNIVKWKVSCIAPKITQSFKLVFNNVNPPIVGDTTFEEVPIGIDPTMWPLDVDSVQPRPRRC